MAARKDNQRIYIDNAERQYAYRLRLKSKQIPKSRNRRNAVDPGSGALPLSKEERQALKDIKEWRQCLFTHVRSIASCGFVYPVWSTTALMHRRALNRVGGMLGVW
jgi:hypothetical protein